MKNNYMQFYMRKVLFLSAILFLIVLFSCKKDGKLTPDFDNGGLSLGIIDTLSLKTSLVLNDSLRTDASIYNPIGLYNDPIFGPTSSSFYTQILLTGVNVDFSSAQIDSLVLTLDYVKLYGDTFSPLNLFVYELDNGLSSSTDYFSNTYSTFKPTPLATVSVLPNLNDSVYLKHENKNVGPHLRIKLPNSLGQNIIDNGPYVGDQDFLNYFKGIYITTQDSVGNTTLLAGKGSIVTFNMNSAVSTLSLYFHENKLGNNQNIPLPDYKKYDFKINSNAVKYSRFAHNYSGTDVGAHLNNLPTKDTTVTYVSALGGVKTKIEIPYIDKLIDDDAVIVNKAELIFTIENGSEGNSDIPLESLSLVGIDENGDAFFLPDFFEGTDYYGGDYDENSKTYTFNIARHINGLITGKTPNYGLFLIANNGTISANRSVIGSEKNTIAKLKLNITYSKL